MAVIVKYVVVSNGKEDMIFNTRKEAEAHDKMLDIAERLYAFLHATEITIAEDTLDALTLFMAQHREHIGTILKGGRLQTPDGRAQALPQDKREESSASANKSSKASQSAPTTKPKAAA